MTPDERSLLERTAAMVAENNKILRSMRSRGRWQMAFQITYWVIILGLTFGAIYLIQPYIDSLMSALGGNGSSGSIGQELQQAMQMYKTTTSTQ
ncbi:MAG: hypothetical protein KGJ35_03795 [Patescibacteria group bacterium]|nr:hypothetical protein [Patescibacteria group bacterium]